MADEIVLLQKRLSELAERSFRTGQFFFSDFLGLAEQSAYEEIRRSLSHVRVTPFGGAEGAERVVLRFGDPEELGYELPFPIVTLRIAPRAPKFAESLTHRDVLGSLMSLGITRDTLGDIVVREGEIFLFCLDSIAPYIKDTLTRIRHTDVKIEEVDTLPEGALYRTEECVVKLTSERLDAVIAKLYQLSREEAQRLFSRSLVFVNGRCIESTSYAPKALEVVSVRGYGRFVYVGFTSETKKGKLNVTLKKYV